MARPVTIKIIKESFSCVCGFHSVEDYEMKIRNKDLRGMTKRKCKSTGKIFFFLKFESDVCRCNEE